jgi:3-dehydroquinate dehydratase II
MWEGIVRVNDVIHVLNGPNLNMLGEREPTIYGQDTLAAVEELCRIETKLLNCQLVFRQTNTEHEMVDWIQAARQGAAGIVINPAAFTYSGYSILDALRLVDSPVIEVHISNIYRREAEWRSKSIITQVATGIITGLGVHGYPLAVRHIARLRERAG